MKAIKVTRSVRAEFLADYAPSVREDVEVYSLEDASKQGFLTSMVDEEHNVKLELCDM